MEKESIHRASGFITVYKTVSRGTKLNSGLANKDISRACWFKQKETFNLFIYVVISRIKWVKICKCALKTEIEGTFLINPQYAFWCVWGNNTKSPNHRRCHETCWSAFCSHHCPHEHSDLSCLPCKEHSAPRCHSTWLISTRQVCSKSFRVLFPICPIGRRSQTVWRTPPGAL